MLSNKKGVSDVVMTVIMILLVIVAIGVVWLAVQSFIGKNTNYDASTSCLGINLEVAKADCNVGTSSCTLIVNRLSGSSAITNLSVVLSTDSSSLDPKMVSGDVGATKTFTLTGVSATGLKRVGIQYLVANGDQQYTCPNSVIGDVTLTA